MLEIRDIKIDNKKAGCVTDSRTPMLSFSLQSDIPDTALKSAIVYVDEKVLLRTENQIGIPLEGLDLSPFASHTIRIQAIDNHNSEANGNLVFQSGRLTLPWTAKWITDKSYSFGKKVSPKPMTFYKSFCVDKEVKRAFITSTAIGIYELELNGKKVGSEFFAPGFTSYKKNLQYQYYDVSTLIKENNVLTSTVAGGWAVGRFTYENKNKITASRQAFLLELFIEYKNGTAEKFITDSSWKVTTEGNVKQACFYDGESFDSTVDLEKCTFKKASEIKLSFSPRVSLSNNKVIEKKVFQPVKHFKSSDGSLIYDFGQNAAGVVQLEINGNKGQVITVRHAEVLDGDKLFTKSLRTAKAEIKYICSDGFQVYMPHFTYMGARYISITGIEEDKVFPTFHTLSSDFDTIGDFSCSNKDLNQLQSNIVWSAQSNFVDIPTDCPQRDERMGWTGDIAVFARTATFNFDLSRFFDKWLLDMRLEQGRGGGIPTVIPIQGCSTPVVSTACWGDSCIIVPWAEYLARGDVSLLRKQYGCMKRYMKSVKFWASLSGFGTRKYIWKWLFQFGDWCAPYGYIKDWMKKGKWIATCYYAASAFTMAKIARSIGLEEDVRYFRALGKQIAQSFNEILTDGKGNLSQEFQTGYVLPLQFGLVNGVAKKKMAENLDRLVRENNYHLATGFPGTPYLLFALADNGYAQTAYKLLLQESCPSWIYELRKGATTLWEQWNAITPQGEIREPSMNHYAYGAVGDFLYRRVLGLEALSSGWKDFCFKPLLGGDLTWAKGQIETPYGLVEASWEISEGKFKLKVKVPVSARCKVILPSGKIISVVSGSYSFEEAFEEDLRK